MAYVKFIFCMVVIPILYFVVVYQLFDISLTELRRLKPSEVGDFLAGIFSPLAFYFLVLGYGQNSRSLKIQATELAASNKAFTAQVEEMRKSAEAQEKMFTLGVDKLNAEKERERQNAIPKFTVTAGPTGESTGHGETTVYFTITLSIQNTPIHTLSITNDLWELSYCGGTQNLVHVPLLTPNRPIEIKLTRVKDSISAIWMDQGSLVFEFYDSNNEKFIETYRIVKPKFIDSPVRLLRV